MLVLTIPDLSTAFILAPSSNETRGVDVMLIRRESSVQRGFTYGFQAHREVLIHRASVMIHRERRLPAVTPPFRPHHYELPPRAGVTIDIPPMPRTCVIRLQSDIKAGNAELRIDAHFTVRCARTSSRPWAADTCELVDTREQELLAELRQAL